MDGPPLSILHLLSYHLYTGPAEPVLRLARAQIEAGHIVQLGIDTHRQGNLEERAVDFGVPIDRRFALSVKAGPLLHLRDLLAFKRTWNQSELDILHVHRSHEHTLAALARPRRTSVRLVRTLHTERAISSGRDWQLKRSDGLVTIARAHRRELIERGVLGEDRIVSVDGVVDPLLFCPGSGGEDIRSEAGVSPDAPVAGIVARMKPDRGHDLLLNAWEQVAQRLPAARLLVAGRGEREEALRARVAGSRRLRDSVRFLGYHRNLPHVYRSFDLKVILAPGNDGTCRAALEAMATGIPVVAADRGALPEIVRDGSTGRIVPGGDEKALARTLVDLLSDREQLARMGRQARSEAQARFSVGLQGSAIEKLYRALAPRSGGSCAGS